VVPTDGKKSNGYKVKYKGFHLNRIEKPFTVRAVRHWHRLPREAVASPSLELFKTQLDTVLGNELYMTLLKQGVGLNDLHRSHATSTILCFSDGPQKVDHC